MVIFKKEKEVVELVIKHLEKVDECLMTASRATEAYINGDIRSAKALARLAGNLEGQADLIRHSIRDKLYSGAYLPLLREDIYRLVECLDKVANAGEACCDFFLNQRPSVPEYMKEQFFAVCKESLGIISALKLAVLCYYKSDCTIEIVREHTKEVGITETAVDKLEWDLTKAIFISQLDFSHKLHLKLCLDSIVEVSDRAEDAADRLELAALKATV